MEISPRHRLDQTDESMASLLRRFIPHLPKRRRWQFIVLFALMLVGAVAEVVTIGAVVPFVALMANPAQAFEYPTLQQAFVALGWQRPQNIVLPMAALFLGVVLVATTIRLLLAYVSNRFVFALGYDVAVRLYERVLNQPYSYHISRNTSEIIAGVNKVQMVIGGVLLPIVQAGVAVVLATFLLGGLLLINARVALAAGLTFAIFYLVVVLTIRARLRANSRRIAYAQTHRVRAVQEALGGIRDVILDGGQQHHIIHFGNIDRNLRTAQAANAFIGQAPRYIIEAIGITMVVGLALFLSRNDGGLASALPMLGALALGAQRLLPLLQQIYNGWSRAMGNRQIFSDILELLSLSSSQPIDRSQNRQFEFADKVELKNISFKYSAESETVLQDVSLTIPRGSRVGIIGRTGSGKSTLMDIIMGLLKPASGEISIDRTPLTEQNRLAWQSRISHVPQNIFIADATIAENIALGIKKQDIDMKRVRACARAAQIADFIEGSRKGYAAPVGERGVALSGGQRQRLAFARALYKRAEVLVLDEATSALDFETEREVMRCVSELGTQITVLIIAHRIQTLRDCDTIYQLDQGRISSPMTYSTLHASDSP